MSPRKTTFAEPRNKESEDNSAPSRHKTWNKTAKNILNFSRLKISLISILALIALGALKTFKFSVLF